jgi:excisionase family DNA binding protein
MAEPFLTLRDVAHLLKISERSVYRLAQRAEVPGFKVGGSWRFRREDIDTWIAAKLRARRRKEAAR